MHIRKFLTTPFLVAGLIILISAFVFWPAHPANAQCGSQASSCKNCHEVQAQHSVNTDGTSWHQSHAFGDFCAVCHAGNSQATDKATAHTGLEAPLADVKASCQQCHVDDLMDRAQIYAGILEVEIGSGGSSAADSAPSSNSDGASTPSSSNDTAALTAPSALEIVVDDPNIVDYVQHYNEIVLGKRPINTGNAILIALIALLLFGGGGYILHTEGWVRFTTEPLEPVPEGYADEIVEMLPNLQKLTSKGRRGLKTLIEDPKSADDLLDAIIRYTRKGT